MLRLPRAQRPAGAVLPRHAEVARPQPHARRYPQLGEVHDHLEPRARPDGGPHNGGCDTCTGVVTVSPTAPSPATRSTTRSATSPASSAPAPGGSPAPRSVRPAGTGMLMSSAFREPRRQPGWSCTTSTTTRATSRWHAATVLRLHAARRSAGHVHLAWREPRAPTVPRSSPRGPPALSSKRRRRRTSPRTTTAPPPGARPAPSRPGSGCRSTSDSRHARTPPV